MIRGITTFKCEKCGHTFVGPDIEWHASAATAPLKCPKCGKTAYAIHQSWLKALYNLWNKS